jgi:hypothetical protein
VVINDVLGRGNIPWELPEGGEESRANSAPHLLLELGAGNAARVLGENVPRGSWELKLGE